jgi:hypothetical protein
MPSNIVRALDVRGLQRLGRLPIAGSQTYKAGDFLTLNSSGELQQAATTGNNVAVWSSGITNLIVGRATEDAQPQANDVSIVPTVKLYGEFIIAEPGTQFALPIVNGASSNGTAAYPNLNLIGTAYALRNTAATDFPTTVSGTAINAGIFYALDISTTTAAKAQIVDWVPDDLTGSTYSGYPDIGAPSAPSSGVQALSARAWVEFLGGACALSGARPITRTN